jgi:hypothetical protein
MGGETDEHGVPGNELRERQRDAHILRLPGIPGYLLQAQGAIDPTSAQPGGLRGRWQRLSPGTRKVAVRLAWAALLVGLFILGALGGGGGGGGGGG